MWISKFWHEIKELEDIQYFIFNTSYRSGCAVDIPELSAVQPPRARRGWNVLQAGTRLHREDWKGQCYCCLPMYHYQRSGIIGRNWSSFYSKVSSCVRMLETHPLLYGTYPVIMAGSLHYGIPHLKVSLLLLVGRRLESVLGVHEYRSDLNWTLDLWLSSNAR